MRLWLKNIVFNFKGKLKNDKGLREKNKYMLIVIFKSEENKVLLIAYLNILAHF